MWSFIKEKTKLKYYPQNRDCFICKGYDCPNDEMDTFGWMDCVNYIKSKERPTENWIHGWLKHKRLVRLLKKKRTASRNMG